MQMPHEGAGRPRYEKLLNESRSALAGVPPPSWSGSAVFEAEASE
jgi:hypothetical protein